jgi:adenosyl cobinamide kinase/adenosyl cobinamide phosphate guanylyltransferase
MVLILGGLGSGKTEYARSLGFSDADFSADAFSDRPVLDHLETLVRSDPASATELLPALLKKEIVICREVGSGVIPLDAHERAWREATGRLCCALAKEATAVVRVVCGVPTVLKGELKCE